jgi:hypothetical protein
MPKLTNLEYDNNGNINTSIKYFNYDVCIKSTLREMHQEEIETHLSRIGQFLNTKKDADNIIKWYEDLRNESKETSNARFYRLKDYTNIGLGNKWFFRTTSTPEHALKLLNSNIKRLIVEVIYIKYTIGIYNETIEDRSDTPLYTNSSTKDIINTINKVIRETYSNARGSERLLFSSGGGIHL